jgi:ATP diphosphatase
MTQRAAGLGFDWSEPRQVLDKLKEEVAELEDALDPPAGRDQAAAEIGDLFFTLVNLARHLGVDPEATTAAANRKFSRRFRHLEARLAQRETRPAVTDLERWWEEAKALEAERSRRQDS